MQHNNRVDTFSICLAGVLFSDFALLMADPTVAFFSSFEGVDVIFKFARDDSVLDRECLELDLASTTEGLLFPFPPEEGAEALLTLLTEPRLFLFDCLKTDADVLVIRSTDFGVSAITLPNLELLLLLSPSAREIDRVDPRASELLVVRFSVGVPCREDIADDLILIKVACHVESLSSLFCMHFARS